MKPHLDPDFLIVEHDPGKLHAHAASLLDYLRNAPRGKGSYTRRRAEEGACWLLEQHADSGVPIGKELAAVARELIEPDPETRTSPVHAGSRDAYWALIQYDARTDATPSSKAAARYLVDAGHFDNPFTAETALRRWRKRDHFRRNVLWQRADFAGLRRRK